VLDTTGPTEEPIMRENLETKVKDTSAPSQEEILEFERFSKNFPKPYSKAEARMLAHDDKNPEVSEDSEEDNEGEQKAQEGDEKKQTLPSIKGAKSSKEAPEKLAEA